MDSLFAIIFEKEPGIIPGSYVPHCKQSEQPCYASADLFDTDAAADAGDVEAGGAIPIDDGAF